MGIIQSLAYSFSKILGDILVASKVGLVIPNELIDSAPAPIPMSISLLLMALAIVMTDCSPDEQNLLIEERVVVSGIPARNIAILETIAPAPPFETFPTHTSLISLGSMLACLTTAYKTGTSMASIGVSF
jgi:hypothetical protein